MLQLLFFQTYNWGYAPFLEPLPIGLMTLCYGDNGSGKTTHLTGLGLLLGVARLPRGKKIDEYIRAGEGWAFLKAIANNAPNAQGKRPFDALVPNPNRLDICTLACRIKLQQGEWKYTYFIVPGDTFEPTAEGRGDPTYTFTRDKYRAALEQVGVRSATMRLLEVGVTGIQDMYAPRDLFDFFVKLIGNETIRSQYIEARREWRRATEQMESTLSQYLKQEKEIREIGKAIEMQKKRNDLISTRIHAERFVDHARLNALRIFYQEKTITQKRYVQSVREVEDTLSTLDTRLEGLKTEEQEFERYKDQWKQTRDQALWKWQEQSTRHAKLTERVENVLAIITDLRHPPIYTVAETTTAHERAHRRFLDVQQEVVNQDRRYHDLTQEVQAIKAGQTTLPPEVRSFLMTLQTQHILFSLVADAINILDPVWCYAVEGILGGERFAIIIPDRTHRLRAMQLAEQARYRYYISVPRSSRPHPAVPEDSLWSVVEVTNEAVAGWVEDLLLPVVQVETVPDGEHISTSRGLITVTPQAYRQDRRGGRSVYPPSLVCGQAARQVRLEQITGELAALESLRMESNRLLALMHKELQDVTDQLSRAREQQHLTGKEQEYTQLLEDAECEQTEKQRLFVVYDDLMKQEQRWTDQEKQLALDHQQLQAERTDLVNRRQTLNDEIRDLRLESLKREIESLETTLPPLSLAMQEIFEREQKNEHEYRQEIQEIERQLETLPPSEINYDETLYAQQQSNIEALERELTQARERVAQHYDIYEKAQQDYSSHIDDLFGKRMAHEFKQLCPLANAKGSLFVVKGDDMSEWSLDVRIGFDGKNRVVLADAPLSRGQEVITSLYLVLAALRAVRATPILLLDELVALLDETNAPRVLQGLRETGVQAFVATPQVRLRTDAEADVIWGFSRKRKDMDEAPPIEVMIRRPERKDIKE